MELQRDNKPTTRASTQAPSAISQLHVPSPMSRQQTSNSMSELSEPPDVSDPSAAEGEESDHGSEDERDDESRNIDGRSSSERGLTSRWTQAEMDKLRDLLIQRRHLEDYDPLVPKLKQAELFNLVVSQLNQIYNTDRTAKAAMQHWSRYGDKNLFPFRSTNMPEGKSKGPDARSPVAPAGTPSQPKKKKQTKRASMMNHSQGEDHDHDDDEGAGLDTSSAKGQKRKSKTTPMETPNEDGSAVPAKRPIFRFTTEQRAILEKEAHINMNPDTEHKTRLATEIGVPYVKVKSFFQNAQAGNYGFSKHLKFARQERQAAAAAAEAAGDSETIANTPGSVGDHIAVGQTPDPEIKRKRAYSRKSLDAELLQSKRSTKRRNPMQHDSENDPPSRLHARDIFVTNKISSAASPNGDDLTLPPIQGFQAVNSFQPVNGFKAVNGLGTALARRAVPPNGFRPINGHQSLRVRPSRRMDLDEDDDNHGSSGIYKDYDPPDLTSNFISPANNKAAETAAATSPATGERVHTPRILVRRTIVPDASTFVPFDPERLRRQGEEASKLARSTMSIQELARADNPIFSPYDVVRDANTAALGNLDSKTKQWEAEKEKLEMDIAAATNARLDLEKENAELKSKYNASNARLKELANEYGKAECSAEDKAVMTREFDELKRWMVGEKRDYNERRDRAKKLKRGVEEKEARLKEVRCWLDRNRELKEELVSEMDGVRDGVEKDAVALGGEGVEKDVIEKVKETETEKEKEKEKEEVKRPERKNWKDTVTNGLSSS